MLARLVFSLRLFWKYVAASLPSRLLRSGKFEIRRDAQDPVVVALCTSDAVLGARPTRLEPRRRKLSGKLSGMFTYIVVEGAHQELGQPFNPPTAVF